MKSRMKAGKVAVLVMQAGLLAFGTGAFAATSFTDAERQQVEKVEKVLFGEARPKLSFESRLRAIEVNLFGDSKEGSNQTRLASIDSVVGGNKSSYLLPPLAASFDPGIEVKQAPRLLDSSSSDYSEATSLLEQAMSDYAAGNSDAAASGFKGVLKQDPDNVDAYFNLGVIAESKGNKIEALRYYENASRLSPSDNELSATVKALRSDLQAEERARIAEKQQAEAARVEHQQVENLKDQVARASTEYKKGNYKQAAGILEQVAARAPSDPDVQFALGQALRGSGDTRQARIAFDRAVAIDPTNSTYRNALKEVDAGLAGQGSMIAQDSRPVGEITPFSSGSGSGFVEKSGLSRTLLGSRLKRTVAGGAVGAAAGALYSAQSSRSIKSGALQGAIMGGLLGYMSGQ